MSKYRVIKRYGHEQGLATTFRQWRAPETHCSKIHGYALAFTLVFGSDTLDKRNWVISFGELKEVKQYLTDTFDHKTLVAFDDPEFRWFADADQSGILDLVGVPHVGMEAFAEMVYNKVVDILHYKMKHNNVRLESVTVAEHDGNAVTYTAPAITWQPNETSVVAGKIVPKNISSGAFVLASNNSITFTNHTVYHGDLVVQPDKTIQTTGYIAPINLDSLYYDEKYIDQQFNGLCK